MSAQNTTRTTGAEWSAILGKNGTNEFATSFAANPVLDASVLSEPCVGVHAIASFFAATKSGMYESLAFTNETVDGRKTYLEWEGKAFGKDVGGTTILTRDEAGPDSKHPLAPSAAANGGAVRARAREMFEGQSRSGLVQHI